MIEFCFLDGVDDVCERIEDALRQTVRGFRIFDCPLSLSQIEEHDRRVGEMLPYGIWHRRRSHTSSELRVKGLTLHNLEQFSWEFQDQILGAIQEVVESAGLRIDKS